MSVYKSKKSPYYSYDFQHGGHRFHGTTKVKSKREAVEVEKQLKAQAKADIKEAKRTGNGPLTIDLATGRFWEEAGKHHAGSKDTWTNLARLVSYFGADKRMDDIDDKAVAALVAWRSGHRKPVNRKEKKGAPKPPPPPLITPSTVNRSTTILLRTVFGRARKVWRYSFPNEPLWRNHLLKEPTERVRELHEGEGEALEASVRADYAPWLEFASLSGLRHKETLLKWENVNWATGQIRTIGKRGKIVTIPITDDIRAVLEPLKGHHPEFVFTYVALRRRGNIIKGRRYPITLSGSKSEWKRTRSKARIKDFRFHDLRHDFASKLLRETGNMKLVQLALNHSDLKTTAKYAHVQDEEIKAAMELIAKSRKNSRTNNKKAA